MISIKDSTRVYEIPLHICGIWGDIPTITFFEWVYFVYISFDQTRINELFLDTKRISVLEVCGI